MALSHNSGSWLRGTASRQQAAPAAERAEQRVDVVLGVVEVGGHAEVLVCELIRVSSASEATSPAASVERTQTSGPRWAGCRWE